MYQLCKFLHCYQKRRRQRNKESTAKYNENTQRLSNCNLRVKEQTIYKNYKILTLKVNPRALCYEKRKYRHTMMVTFLISVRTK